jgi:DNA-binding GntR family transcriptional regulator
LTSQNARDRFERLHAELRSRICLLDYPPGMRLSEQTLAEEFGVSRTPLRRVLVRLEGEGLLQSVQGVGTFVTDVEIEEMEQTYRLRLELAELTGRLDPVQPDAALWSEFLELAARSHALIGDPDPRHFAQINMDFFLALLRLTENEPLRDISERLYFRTARIWLKSIKASTIDMSEEAIVFNREVDDILTALKVGDLHAASLIQRAHISMSFNRMLKGVTTRQEAGGGSTKSVQVSEKS